MREDDLMTFRDELAAAGASMKAKLLAAAREASQILT